MQDDLKNILSNEEHNIDRDKLMKYLKDELEQAQKHEVEMHAIDDAFESDALEGLAQLESKQRIELIVDGLNREVRKKTTKKMNLRKNSVLKPQWWLYFSIIILLIILALVYLFLHKNING